MPQRVPVAKKTMVKLPKTRLGKEGEILEYQVVKSAAQWRKELSAEAYHVLREAGTEPPGSGKLLDEDRPGIYYCGACRAPLFRANEKFTSYCGWPAFFAPLRPAAVLYREDNSLAQVRTEVLCSSCGSHLGHVFPDAPQTPTGLRYCMNSLALYFVPDTGSIADRESTPDVENVPGVEPGESK